MKFKVLDQSKLEESIVKKTLMGFEITGKRDRI